MEINEIILGKLNRLESKLDSMQSSVNQLKIEQAVHEIKINRSSAFFGSISGMLVAILTAVIINYVSSPKEITPKVIYKNEPQKVKPYNENTL